MMRIFIALCAVLSGAAHAVVTDNKDPWITVLDPSSQKTYFVHRHTREKRWASEDRAAPDTTDIDTRVGWSQRPFGEYVGLSDKELEQHIEAWLKREDQRERDGVLPDPDPEQPGVQRLQDARPVADHRRVGAR